MTKREGIIYLLGEINGCIECKTNYKTFKLGDVLGKKYDKYLIGLSNCDDSVCVLDTGTEGRMTPRGRFVIEIHRKFPIEDLVNLILAGLAADLRSQKK